MYEISFFLGWNRSFNSPWPVSTWPNRLPSAVFRTWVIPINLKYCLFLAAALEMCEWKEKGTRKVQIKSWRKFTLRIIFLRVLTRRQCRFLDRPHRSRRHRLRWCRYVGCTIEADDMVWLNNEGLSAAVCLLCGGSDDIHRREGTIFSINLKLFSLPPALTHLLSHLTFYLCSYLNTEKGDEEERREMRKGKIVIILAQREISKIFFIFIVH